MPGVTEKCRMAKALPGSTRPIVQMMPRPMYPSICGKPDCAHLQCLAIRHQNALPCDVCHQLIAPGEDLYVLARAFGTITRQMHKHCAEASL